MPDLPKPETILVYVGLDAVGDGLIKLPFLRALRAAFPTARITWMSGKGPTVFQDILAPLVTGLIDEILAFTRIGERPLELVGRRPLPDRSFDLIIDTQRRGLTTLILKRIRHRRFISATAGYLFSDGKPADTTRPASMIRQLMQLVEAAAGQPVDADFPLPRDPAIEAEADRLLPPGPRYLGFAPGAGGRWKCWPLDRYIALAAAQKDAVPVFLLGPAEAEDWAATIREALPQALLPLQDTARLTPMLTIALGRRLAAAVANDSGTGHMLGAADIPLVSLFGPTAADKFAPHTRRAAVLRAQDFGGEDMEAIPQDAVEKALALLLL
ncbi:ADP-heptose:LPS heptosyltransferase [Paramagnetospirillum magnetotacticum MS-1]|uniref:ADP-heptose:LPS heptosyltransferase n=1 Tax=Paramagnetospirillum magnetotacticum MS-1 TaxID=272627 RepID=A0A0C2YTJ4_PARME|nr:glycosyltransferase family 9 protein [Paramagnetospirillum magnetotacticum]KIL98473.1 ADP-heptose:LPS heptosyltransferase [Paramagnetospirillum magnetotacticum MS-1]